MKSSCWVGAISLLAVTSVCRADCDDLRSALSSALSGDTTLDLSGDVDCPILDNNLLEEFVVDGGTLTLTGPSTTKFTNLRFTVMDGAGLIFDFDMTEFGPNLGFDYEDDYGGYMMQVMSGGSVEFTGEMTGTGLTNMRSVFYNEAGGSIEFASNAVFADVGTNVFRSNYGRLRFYGDATFTNNRYLAIENDGGSVRINGDALFMENGGSFDGHNGGAFSNFNGGVAIFRGFATFGSNECDGNGGGFQNGADSKMTFYKKVGLYDNRSKDGDGGAVDNAGELKFRGAVFVTGNRAAATGGAFTMRGGTTSFYGWATIQSNDAGSTGGAMSIFSESVVDFRRPARVDIRFNEKTQDAPGCNAIDIDETSQLIGYNVDDVCEES
ncbi:unnamed protein product [Scytosiphon promiscuus]